MQTIIYVRIQANTESIGREYAAQHGTEQSQLTWWLKHCCRTDSRLYTTVIDISQDFHEMKGAEK